MTRPQTTFRQNLANFDGAWFIRVAAIGYQRLASGDYDLAGETERLAVMDELGYEDGKKLFGYRHWPLMPWIMRLIAPLTGGYLNAGILVSNGFYFLMAIMLYRLCRLDYGHSVSLLAVVLVSVHPGAWSLTVALNESLFMACATASLVALRTGRFVTAGIWGMLMAMARPGSIVVMLPLLYEYLALGNDDPLAPVKQVLSFENIKKRTLALTGSPRALLLLLIPGGTLLAMGFYHLAAGTPFAFTLAHESGPQGHVNLPWQVLYYTWLRGPEFQLKESVLHLLTLIVFIASCRQGRRSYLMWMILFTIFHNLHSAHSFLRYHLHLIPFFVMSAAILDRHPVLRSTVVCISAGIMGLFGAMFVKGYWLA